MVFATWALLVCLICAPRAPGAHISGRPPLPMLQILNMICANISINRMMVLITFLSGQEAIPYTNTEVNT